MNLYRSTQINFEVEKGSIFFRCFGKRACIVCRESELCESPSILPIRQGGHSGDRKELGSTVNRTTRWAILA
jgi:hypothetical protein